MTVRTLSAESLFSAMHAGQFSGPLRSLLQEIAGMARVGIWLDECDAASGNDTLHPHLLSLDRLNDMPGQPGVLREQSL